MAFYLPLLRQTGKDYLIMLKSITLVFISFFAANSVSLSDVDAKELSWATLADVEYKDVYLEELDAWFWQPEFGDAVKEYSGEQVYITGYMVPVDVSTDYFVLSRYPFAQCFFCGNAGPESVVDLRMKKEGRKFKQDERLTFTGKLRLNETDVYELNYILEEAIENK
jgi:hypothetical protein|tara:strand:+ start:1683 stop:2183 length:501 start_codon:yes stop_codon:yes gene_type:complete